MHSVDNVVNCQCRKRSTLNQKEKTKMIKHIKILLNPDADTFSEMVPHYIGIMCGLLFIGFLVIVKIATGA